MADYPGLSQSPSAGFAGGWAGGLQGGLALGNQLQRTQFEEGLQSKADQRAQDEMQRKTDAQNLELVNQARDDTAKSLYLNQNDPDKAKALNDQLTAQDAARDTLTKKLLGQQAYDTVTQAKQNADELRSGDKSVDDMTPQEFRNFVTVHTSKPVSYFLQGANGEPSQSQKDAMQTHAGMQQLAQTGDPSGVVSAFKQRYDGELNNALTGQKHYDGSTVTGAQFLAPVPHPDSPNHFTMATQVQTQAPDGKVGTQVAPLMEDTAHMTAHPDDTSDANVRTFNTQGVMNHMAGEDLFGSYMATPQGQAKLRDGYASDEAQNQQNVIDMLHRHGFNENEFIPKGDVEIKDGFLYQKDSRGNLVGKPIHLPDEKDRAIEAGIDPEVVYAPSVASERIKANVEGPLRAAQTTEALAHAGQANAQADYTRSQRGQRYMLIDAQGNQTEWQQGDDIPNGSHVVKVGTGTGNQPKIVMVEQPDPNDKYKTIKIPSRVNPDGTYTPLTQQSSAPKLDASSALAQAKAAIAAGKDPNAVAARFKQMGFDPAQLSQ